MGDQVLNIMKEKMTKDVFAEKAAKLSTPPADSELAFPFTADTVKKVDKHSREEIEEMFKQLDLSTWDEMKAEDFTEALDELASEVSEKVAGSEGSTGVEDMDL